MTQSLPNTEQLDVTAPAATDLLTLLELNSGASIVTVRSKVWTKVALTD